jgi:ubiquinone biosynthesis accessory factor UbiJ
VIQTAILGALNHLLAQASWARRQLLPFAGRRARFEMPPWQLAFGVDGEGLFEAIAVPEVDVTVSLPADGPLLALQGIDRLMATAHVTGNAEFATALSFVLKNLRWDAEEDLSRLVGDIAAHRLVGGLSVLAAWQKQASRNLAENLAEYLGEEAHLLTPAGELAMFRSELADFSHRLAHLQTRVKAVAKTPLHTSL